MVNLFMVVLSLNILLSELENYCLHNSSTHCDSLVLRDLAYTVHRCRPIADNFMLSLDHVKFPGLQIGPGHIMSKRELSWVPPLKAAVG